MIHAINVSEQRLLFNIHVQLELWKLLKWPFVCISIREVHKNDRADRIALIDCAEVIA